MRVAIIGGAGKMGRWFAKFFTEEGMSVVAIDKDEEKLSKLKDETRVDTSNNTAAVENADRILISVPIDDFEGVVREIHSRIRPNQVIMDVCSVKEFPVQVMHHYIKTGITLGTHPMFGPGAKNVRNQNFIFTPTNQREEIFAGSLGGWLEERGANVFIMSPRRHDELMSVVLGLPHLIGIVVCDTLLSRPDLAETRKVAGITYKLLLTLAEAVASEEPVFYADLQMRLPEIEEIEGLFCKKSMEWVDLVKKRNKSEFTEKMRLIQEKLGKTNPNYRKSYDVMYKLLDTIH